MQFQDVPHSLDLEEKCQSLSRQLSEEFPEALTFDVTQSQAGADQMTTVHVTGRDIDLASSSTAEHSRESVNDAFSKVRRQLRKHHDKQIFKSRRNARHGAA